MKRVGLIGHPIVHSLSPAIHNAAFVHYGREERYELWDTEASALQRRVRGLRDDDFFGANVTVPHKQAVMPYLDRLDSLTEQTGAVNTIVNEHGRLAGYNTDVAGFEEALFATGFSPKGQRAVVLGAGGAAHAVGLALVRGGTASVDVADIDLQRARALADHLRMLAPDDAGIRAHSPADPAFRHAVASCRLLVNCTPVGTRHSEFEGKSPLTAELIPSGALVFDLVYNPPLTPLMAATKERGAKAVGGLSMLVYQAAASFKLWTGLEAPIEVIMAAAREALEKAD
jgi:shikimate dehydrogenase